MNGTNPNRFSRASHYTAALAALWLGVTPAVLARTLEITVKDAAGNPVSGFYYLVEEDNTNQPMPGALVSDSQALDISRSHAPVAASGSTSGSTASVAVPDGLPFYVSVLPFSGHGMSGAPAPLNRDQITVIVNSYPVPTAQITVLVFHDNAIINNAPDLPAEQGLPGFSVKISDMGGQVMLDAFGNPLGTTYAFDPETGAPEVDPETGAPVVEMMGTSTILTNAAGEVTIKNIPPGKYGVQVIPPAGQGWAQTTTIEGTETIDAWVMADEPPLLVEFGPAMQHIFVGFVQPFDDLASLGEPGGPTATITGQVRYAHTARPPMTQGLFAGPPVEDALIGLNVEGRGVYAAWCEGDSTFTITGVPAGTYQLVTWDKHLDSIFGFNTLTVPDPVQGWNIDLGNVLAFAWFGWLDGSIFYDSDADGFRDPMEMGYPNEDVILRFRDGTIYQIQPTDHMGNYSLTEVFPFFKWLILEVGFARLMDTGYTCVIDYGGEIPPHAGWGMPSFDVLVPQPQFDEAGDPLINPNTGNNLSRTESGGSPGEYLLQGMQLYAGQTNRVDFGKVYYSPGENGGISGLVYYAVTRAEGDPRYAVAEPWEPGIPRVQVVLYQDDDEDGFIDDLNEDGGPTLSDVDNHPLGWLDSPYDPGAKGPEDVDWDEDGIFDPGDALSIVHTDSFDDNRPTGCVQDLPFVHGEWPADCFDNFATWNQLRPTVFDGGFAIGSYFPGGMEDPDTGGIDLDAVEVEFVPPGTYIVEAVPPAGYDTVKEEDKNVDYGDEYIPSTRVIPPACAGEDHLVPDFLTLFGDIEAPFAGDWRPLCDRKQVYHSGSQNTAVEFFMFTPVPKAARGAGFINNDLAAEGDPTSPLVGEKQAPSWIPISFRDWNGNEVNRVYCDEYGAYNVLLPSTFTVNIAAPSGVSPNMIQITLNDPGPVPDPNDPGQMIIDPWFDPSYTITRYTFDFAAGKTTFLDTPVIPVAAFVGYPNRQIDCKPPSGTPMIYAVIGDANGPIVCTDGATITIESLGNTEVANPDYDMTVPGSPLLITRDFGFGDEPGQVTVDGVPLNITNWSNASIQATVDFGAIATGQLMVTRADTGLSTPIGITLHVGDCGNVVYISGGSTWPATPIQDAIDAASAGTLILIGPGMYNENPIVYKNVRLQGAGAGSTIINGAPVPPQRVTAWHDKINALLASGDIVPLSPDDAQVFFTSIEGATLYIQGQPDTFSESAPGLVDGLTIMGSVAGGALYAASHADYLEISNNEFFSCQGSFGGGITVGMPSVGLAGPVADSYNDHPDIHHNAICKTGGINGGGAITLFGGAHHYRVTDNFLCGNFSRFVGGGICHHGLSDDGLIARNRIVFNEVTYGALLGGEGAGIYIGGFTTNPEAIEAVTGSGSVTIDGNLIQGNLAGSGSGGAVRAELVNGAEVEGSDPSTWYTLNLFNNMIIDNIAAYRGGGISLYNAARVNIVNNTVAHNDSTATAALAFPAGDLLHSLPQGAGLVAEPHSAALVAATGQAFSNPVLVNNIFWQNRSFVWNGELLEGWGDLVPADPLYRDFEIVGPGSFDPRYCILTDATGFGPTNFSADPLFEVSYFNTLSGVALLEEGGNSITIRTRELSISNGDYHLQAGSPAIDAGSGELLAETAPLARDYDQQPRVAECVDIGADEAAPGACEGIGDVNCDGSVNVFDIDPFVLALTDPAGYAAAYPECSWLRADANGDGLVNVFDIDPFVILLTGGAR